MYWPPYWATDFTACFFTPVMLSATCLPLETAMLPNCESLITTNFQWNCCRVKINSSILVCIRTSWKGAELAIALLPLKTRENIAKTNNTYTQYNQCPFMCKWLIQIQKSSRCFLLMILGYGEDVLHSLSSELWYIFRNVPEYCLKQNFELHPLSDLSCSTPLLHNCSCNNCMLAACCRLITLTTFVLLLLPTMNTSFCNCELHLTATAKSPNLGVLSQSFNL